MTRLRGQGAGKRETLIDAAQVARVMAGGADRRTFILALAGAGLASAIARFPVADATRGVWFAAIAAASLLLFGVPVLVAESALGQYRRRNVVDGYGPGPWRGVGLLHALGATVAVALLAILAGWSARFAYGSFQGTWFGDPDRAFRLYAAGPDALLGTLAALAVATGVAMRGVGRGGARSTIAAAAVVTLLVAGGMALWANTRDGAGEGRDALLDWDADGIDASFVVRAVLAGLLPALLATGLATTRAARSHDRALPRQVVQAALLALLGLAGLLFAIAPLAAANGVAFDGGPQQAFSQLPTLFGAIGSAEGGILAGAFYGAFLFVSLVAVIGLLDVPATWLAESGPSWSPRRGFLASGLAAFLIAVPFCFSATGVAYLSKALAWIAAPLGAVLVCLHVGWKRPEVLDRFRVGDAGHALDKALLPLLRFVLAPVFLALLLFGVLGFSSAVGGGGSGGLWDFAP